MRRAGEAQGVVESRGRKPGHGTRLTDDPLKRRKGHPAPQLGRDVPTRNIPGLERRQPAAHGMEPPRGIGRDGDAGRVIHGQHADRIQIVGLLQLVPGDATV